MSLEISHGGQAIAAILEPVRKQAYQMPLVAAECPFPELAVQLRRLDARSVLPHSRAPEAALAGLFTLIGSWNDAHETSSHLTSAEGSFWHGILHRQEPDPANAEYWFRRVGQHPIFPELSRAAQAIARRFALADRIPERWSPTAFVALCGEAARQPDSPLARCAAEIQMAEWNMLFDYCAAEPQA